MNFLGGDLLRSDDNCNCSPTNFYTRMSDEEPQRSKHLAFYKKKALKITLVI